MEQLVVCPASDLHRLQHLLKDVPVDTMVLLSDGEFDLSLLSRLETHDKLKFPSYRPEDTNSRKELMPQLINVQRAYFAVSSPAMHSTAYQVMIYSLFPRLLQIDCWKITLDKERIPLGFAFMRHLPEGSPAKNTLLHRVIRFLSPR